MLTGSWLLATTLAAACFYLGTRHQRFRPSLYARAGALRVAGAGAWVIAAAAAIVDMGLWAGGFAALTSFMAAGVLLPYLDAWRRLGYVGGDVG